MGEFGLISRLAEVLGPPASDDAIVGIGDDAAVLRFGREHVLVTTDTMVQAVHFLPGSPWEDIGWKALASNVSDIAAMGGEPRFALVTLALPAEQPAADSESVYAGLRACAERYGVSVVGGDVVRAQQVAITIALLGVARSGGGEPLLLRRAAARPGDAIALTGTVGDAVGGLLRMKDGTPPDDALVRAHLHPEAQLAAGAAAVTAGIRCAIDVSDGLLQDVGHICEMSGVGAVVQAGAIPVSEALRKAFGKDSLRLACTGGEDYQLVVVGQAALMEGLIRSAGVPVTVIGEIIDSADPRVRLLDDAGREITFPSRGWDAFRS
jgi:thiamine-monophosphate kinase